MSQPPLLAGDVTIVTGAARGIGRAIAHGVAAAGARVIVADLDLAGAEAVAAEIGEAAFGARVDIGDRRSCEALAALAEDRFGPVSVVVNNAGVLLVAPVDAADHDTKWATTYRVNVDGILHMVQATLPQLRATRGRVVNITSSSATLVSRGGTMYASAKGAAAQLTRALAVELGGDGIRVNAVAPGNTRTAINGDLPPDHPTWRKYIRRMPLGRTGEPDDLIGPTLFLASAMSGFVTGATIPVDGGYTITGILDFDEA